MKRTQLYFYVIIALMLLGATSKRLTLIAVMASAFMALVISSENLEKSNEHICKGIVLLLLMQNVCIGIGAHMFHNTDSSLQYLTQIPFISTFVIWAVTCSKKLNVLSLKSPDTWFVILLFFIMLSISFGFGGFASSAVSIRNLTVFFMAYCIGRKNITSKASMKRMIRYLALCGISVTLIGIVIMAGGYALYRNLGIHEVYIAKASPFPLNQLGGRFYTSLFSGRSLFRMGSIYYEPVNMGYFLSCCLLCCICDKSWGSRINRIIAISIIGLGLILTFGKGGYLITAVGIACVFIDSLVIKKKDNSKSRVERNTVIIIMIIAAVFALNIYMNRYGYAVWTHIWAIQRTFRSIMMHPFGYGLGMGGNAAHVFSQSAGDWLSTGGETALLSFMFQIGVQGVIALIGCFVAMSHCQSKTGSGIYKLFIYLPYILIGVSIMQDNTFTPQCIIPFMIMQGGGFSTQFCN